MENWEIYDGIDVQCDECEWEVEISQYELDFGVKPPKECPRCSSKKLKIGG
ncbi:hypothetical protein GCM10011571_32990 [Marinithermofilum abyssi]|uniref:Uncharacterized protein n=1 Tax=Marinithermofilum abyssi TaxID=1571185 RepID=A0A8J2VF89_9BACL|nr:hypothetical protein GCM10011571_32990 [Marinithermofilum abyssi]